MFKFLKKKKETETPKVEEQVNVEKEIKSGGLKEELIKEIVEATGWTAEKAEEEMKDAKKRLGIKFKEYVRYKLYDIPVEKQQEEYDKVFSEKEIQRKKKNKERKEKCIKATVEGTGWTEEEANEKIQDARKRLGIKYNEYRKHKFYEIPVEEQAERYEQIKAEVKAQKDKEEITALRKEAVATEKKISKKRVLNVIEKTGWTYEFAKAEMLDAKERLGVTGKEYERFRLYSVPKEEQLHQYKKELAKKEKREKKRESQIKSVMDVTGWDYEVAKANMDKAKEISGAEYKDYLAYKFWEISEEEQSTYFTKGDANALRKKYNTNKINFDNFMDKSKFNTVFNEYLGRPWACNIEVSFEEFKEKFQNEAKIMYKPLAESCGSGIAAYKITEDNIESVYNELKALPIGVVEGYIAQHKEMAEFSINSVNTVRAVTVYADGEVHLLYAAFRMGGGDAVVDNFHNGGVLALIDVATGEVVTNAIDLKARVYENHPTTGKPIKGFVIPHWDAVVEMLKKAGKEVEGVGYVGWDIAITETQPVFIEGNTAPAPNVLQLPYSLERKGMKHIVSPFL